MKIQTIRLTNFRAFPGPAPAEFELGGKNLLVYGENGSGKSSLFHALRGFFSYGQPPDLVKLSNSFSGMDDKAVSVELSFMDQSQAAWKIAAMKQQMLYGPDIETDTHITVHPTRPISGTTSNINVIEAAKFSACLDYRSLLNINFVHQDRTINLFEVMVGELLAGFVDLATNKTIAELWVAAQRSIPLRNTENMKFDCYVACMRFNDALKRALDLLLPEARAILQQLSPQGLTLDTLSFNGIGYNGAKAYSLKALTGKTIGLGVSFRGLPLERPQHYLNEARQSAVALSLYLAARLACAPQTTPHLKLLVLDDVLIGLDHSNRLPVLDVLMAKFPAWQIVLLTHDRGWFDLARERLGNAWACYEIYEGDAAAAAPMPIVRATESRPARALLAKGRELLALGYVEAAANYTRQAFEHGLRGGCEVQRIKLNYKINPKDHQAQDLLDAIKNAPRPAPVPQADWTACLQNIELFKNVVMNPYSHPSAPNIPRQEVEGAANAVEKFLELARKR
jgi:AAA domain